MDIRINLGASPGLLLLLVVLGAFALWDRCDRRGDDFWITRHPSSARGDELAMEVAHEALDPAGQAALRERLGPRMSAHGAPVQENLPRAVSGWEREGFTFHPRAAYGVEARVLATQTYRHDPLAPIAPVDYALGWGAMTDPEITDPLGVRISRRFYSYRWRGRPPLPPEVMARSSANKHLIPATPEVEADLRRARRHDWVRLYGYLVEIQRPDGFVARTSLVRTDQGAGACENIWVVAVAFPDAPAPLGPDAPRP